MEKLGLTPALNSISSMVVFAFKVLGIFFSQNLNFFILY